MKNWLRVRLQWLIFAPEPGVNIAGVSASGMLLRALNGRPLVAIDSQGNIGSWGLRAGTVKDLTPRSPGQVLDRQPVSNGNEDAPPQRNDPNGHAPLIFDSNKALA